MEGWIFCYLKDIVDELIMGQSPDSSSYNNEEKGIAFVQGNADMQSEVPLIRMFTTDPKRFSELNDILLSVRAPVGDVFYNNYGCLAIGRGLSAIRIKNRDLRTLVYYYLQFDKRQFESLEQGTTFTEIGKKEVRNIRIAIPQNPYEQTAIANILSKVDEAIASVQNSIAAAERLKKSLMQNLLTGKMKPDGTFRTPEEFYIDKKFGKVPIGWEVKKVQELSIQVTDGEHQTPERTSEGYYLLSARNIKNGYLSLDDVDYIPEKELLRIQKRCNPQGGDILISCSGTIGNVCIVPDGFVGGMVRSAALVKLKKDMIEPRFAELMFQFHFMQNQMKVAVASSVQGNIFQGAIRNLRMFYPKDSLERLVITNCLHQFDMDIALKQKKVIVLERLKKSLMQNLLTGKVRTIN